MVTAIDMVTAVTGRALQQEEAEIGGYVTDKPTSLRVCLEYRAVDLIFRVQSQT